jgi:hypothetical protein
MVLLIQRNTLGLNPQELVLKSTWLKNSFVPKGIPFLVDLKELGVLRLQSGVTITLRIFSD